MKKTLLALGMIVSLSFSQHAAAQSFTENFDDITTLVPGGWFMQNNSTTIGTAPTWFQGDGVEVFPAYNGGINSYIGANYNSTTGNSTISNWLLTPTRTFKNGDVFTFYTRKPVPFLFDYPDRLQVRLSTNGASTNVGTTPTSVGDFTTVLLEVNPTLAPNGYPVTWTQYTITISGLAAPASGRIAFRYFVTSGGPDGANSDFIGIDNVVYTAYTCPTLTVSHEDPLMAAMGMEYSGSSFTQTGALGAATYTVSDGELPPGMSLSASGALSGTPTETGEFVFTVTVSDASGCSGSEIFTMSVGTCDILIPDVITDIESECSVEWEDVTPPGIGDTCGNVITLTTDETIFPVTAEGTTVITWSYTDFYGNAGTIEQNIIIDDQTAPEPVIAELPDITAECQVTGDGIVFPEATDNCTGVVTVTPDVAFPISAQGTTVITWTYDDGNGNTATQTQNVIIEDTTAPDLTVEDITVEVGENGTVTLNGNQFGFSDACGIEGVGVVPAFFTCDELGDHTITVTATDVNGNSTSATATVTVTDPNGYCEAASVADNSKSSLKLYPNPAKGIITISNANGASVQAIAVYSLSGQKLYSAGYKEVQEQYTVSLDRFQAGTYLVMIETASGVITKRVVKMD